MTTIIMTADKGREGSHDSGVRADGEAGSDGEHIGLSRQEGRGAGARARY